MTEHTDNDANNLCITEEVFEKFQAESMYEEEELITLSDILPTNASVAPSVHDDVNDLLADDNVALSHIQAVNCDLPNSSENVQHFQITSHIQTVNSAVQNSSENVQLSEITTGPGAEIVDQDQLILETSDINVSENVQLSEITTVPGAEIVDQDQLILETSDINVSENVEIHTEPLEENKPKRRGRQKKSVQESSLNNVSKEQIEVIQPKRRGRRKKIDNYSINDISIEDEMKLIHEGNPDITNNETIQENIAAEENTVPQISKRRGRKKKLAHEPNIDTSVVEKTNDLSKGSDMLDININSQNGQDIGGPKRRGRKKKIIQNDNIDNSLEEMKLNSGDEKLEFAVDKMDVSDDLPISEMKNKELSTSDSTLIIKGRTHRGANKTLTECFEKNKVTPGKKRGRSKKQPQLRGLPQTDLSQPQINIDSSIDNNIMEVEEPSSTVEKPESIVEPTTINETKELTIENDIDIDDDADDISLSNLKQALVSQENADIATNSNNDIITSTTELKLEESEIRTHESPTKRNSKAPVLPDFEYNLDNIANDGVAIAIENLTAEIKKDDKDAEAEESLLVEDTNRRPTRRKIKQNFRYQEDSDEDPFANVELSDDEPKRSKRGTKYYSDDEYIPGKKRGKVSTESSQSSDLDAEDLELELEGSKKQKRKRFSKKIDSPKKKGKKNEIDCLLDVTTIPPASTNSTDDIEVCLESSVIKNPQIDESSENKSSWGHTNEFENFIAQKIQGTELKIKKVSATASATAIVPLDIPTLDPTAKKVVEKSTQTSTTKKNAQGVQTSPPYDIPMKENVSLTNEQSEKACEFLNSIVKTTSELGVLMTQKSEDFMKKKIHTGHVTDTFKMDYCVRKSFLLFKLAKHNLLQMEEDLAKQYEEFLRANDLHKHRELIKTIASTSSEKTQDNDSDCEIVEVKPGAAVTTGGKKNEKAKVNPKTVFLNKELSIKITKKPSDKADKKLNIKERHTVWINDSVILKKVKPTQSFLAQDSRNKKPPDNTVFEEIVHNFFREYERQKVMSVCAPFVSNEWINVRRQYACNYFVASPEITTATEHFVNGSSSETVSEVNKTISETKCESVANLSSPKSLFSLCTLIIQKNSYFKKFSNAEMCIKKKKQPQELFHLCLYTLNKNIKSSVSKTITYTNVLELKTICYKKVVELFSVNINSDTLTNFLPVEENIFIGGIKKIMPKKLNINEYNVGTSKREIRNGVKTLFSLCVEFIQDKQKVVNQDNTSVSSKDCKKIVNWDDTLDKTINDSTPLAIHNPHLLKNITYNKILHLMYNSYDLESGPMEHVLESATFLSEVKTLGNICLDVIKAILFDLNVTKSIDMTINSINTLSEEAFFNIEDTCTVEGTQYQYFDEDTNCYEDEFEPEYEFTEDTNETGSQESNWVNQVQMKEFKSCLVSNMSNTPGESIHDEPVEPPVETPSEIPFMVNIKSEPFEEELVENLIEPVNVKTEPTQELRIALEHVTTKAEPENSNTPRNQVQRTGSYDGDAFEQFVVSNKMMLAVENAGSEEIFSQSALRIRRQFDPDSDDENDAGMSLLVPHTYQPLKITDAKDTLMQSSSDEGNKDVSSKKKIDRRKKKTKKIETKTNNKEIETKTNNKEVETKTNGKEVETKACNASKNKTKVNNEVAVLTRRMRERIRQEEKKVQSSDSDNETIETRSKTEKKKGKVEETLASSQKPQKKYDDTDIQCNNVDSTEQIDNTSDKNGKQKDSIPDEIFTGFSAVDQNEICTYQKYLKNVYDKILPKIDTGPSVSKVTPTDNEQHINADEPVEYLECEPILPIFEKEPRKRSTRKNAKVIPNKDVPESIVQEANISDITPSSESQTPKEKVAEKATKPISKSIEIVDRHGWQCYPIDVNDKKLYDGCQILLDKLPETFVEMYFQYQDITERSKEDEEVDKLINLQSLTRASTVKELKNRTKVKDKTEQPTDIVPKVENNLDDSRPNSPGSDHYHELTPSEDEGSDHADETLAPIEKPASENNIAKSSLMDENSDSDADNAEGKLKKVKEEPIEDASKENMPAQGPKRRPGPKSKTKVLEQKPAEHPDLMLTADKMMNKELNLLHAPINLDESVPEVPAKKTTTRGKQKNSSRKEIHYRIKNEDDSSSEEEKQWVTTKEKLLKRLEKRQDTTIADEAKRTKIVSEYIERRGENAETRMLRLPQRRRGRRSNKKFLERQKQLRVLTRELLGDAADSAHHTKRYNQAFFKGRRNIRKVIDKKSLAKSTVMANMEEFERKRRLSMKQVKLREQLGCEEDVNVLVINDELCLEYDFEQQQPAVSIHPFFTKIMKAHQYEGVKFMWDACFESLSQLATGHPGGGCILAHCMGLGKTLQVLALLHTVLTHPGVPMQRVLVCCPLSTVLNWVDEIHKWIGPVTDQIKVFELSKLKKTYERAYQLEDWYSGGGIFIIGYELFRSLTTLDPFLDDVRPTIVKKIRTALLDPGPDIIVCDEGHLLKNDCSVLAVAMSRVVTRRRIVLTGTPMQNNLREYYCMVNFVKPNLLGTYSEYSNRFENPIMNGQHRDSSAEDIKLMKARTHILHKVLEGCLQRQEASVLYPYLPKKHEYTVFISLTKCQWDMYKYYLTHYANKAKHGVLKDFHILQKVWSHPQVLHHFHTKARDVNTNKVKTEKLEDDLAEEDAATEDIKPADADIWWPQFLEGGAMLDSLESSNKFVVVFRILDECIKLGDKVLIFSTSLFTMDALEFFLRKINKWSLGQEYYRLDGSVPAEVRQKWCREFNAEHNLKTKLFLISTRAGSLGLNMTAANRVIILDTSWNPAHDIQSIFRVYRFGQKKDCYIYRLVALGTMEQKIYERSVTKQAVACRVVDEQQIDRHYNMQELTELYRFDESGSGVESGVAAGVRDVALLRVARLRALHAVHEHDSLLRGSEPALPEHERQAAWSQFQLEHENGQIEDNKKVKKIAVKRTYNKAAPATAVKAEPGADDSPDFKPKEPKAKRGRKSANQVEPEGESILPDPDTDRINTLDPNTEQSMVKKITELLVKHNFSHKDEESALPQLVMNVRRIVMSGQNIDRCDELTASIAKVLMLRQDNMSMPLVNGIIGESVNQTISQNQQIPTIETPLEMPPLKPRPGRPKKGKAGPKCRKGYVYEEVPSTSTAPQNVPLFDRLLLPNKSGTRKTKRKAALAAEKLLDTAVEDGVIDIDDDDDYSDTDTASETNTHELIPQPKTKNPDVHANITITEKAAPTKEPKARKSKTIKPIEESMEVLEDVMDTSILLSDDEEGLLKTTAVELEPEGEVSVHPSLLKNNNFIKIVAHTYLAGNPMLDEDAAMLAARYSTYKAVKELETSGKPITSGPIYDIAVQVLGKPILKKLHETNHKMDTSEDDASSSLLLDLLMSGKEQPKASDNTPKAQESKPSEKATKVKAEKVKAPEPSPVPKVIPEKPKKEKKKPAPRRRKVYRESDDDSDVPIEDQSPQVQSNAPTSDNQSYLSQVLAKQGVPWPKNAGPRATDGTSNVTVMPSTPSSVYPMSTPSSVYPTSTPQSVYQRSTPSSVYQTSTHQTSMPSSVYPPPMQPQGVVPVGLFKTTVTLAVPGEAQAPARETADECILPDDDDVRIVSDAPEPVLPPLTSISAPTPQITAPTMVPMSKLVGQPSQPMSTRRTKTQPLILKMVRSGNNPQVMEVVPSTQSATPTQYRIATSEPQSQPQPQVPITVSARNSTAIQPPQMTDNTICLDSDDEDAPSAPAVAPQPTPVPTAISVASNAYSTPQYVPIQPKEPVQATATKPVKLRLSKVDPSKFVVTTKKHAQAAVQAPVDQAPVETKEPPVRYIVIPKSQVAQIYPPLVPLPVDQVPGNTNHIIQANPDGTFTLSPMQPNIQMAGPAPNTSLTHTEKQVDPNVFTHVQVQSRPDLTATTPTSTPTVAINSGRILRKSIRRNETTVPTTSKTPTIVEQQLTPAKSVTPASTVTAAKPVTPAKPAERQRSISASSDSDSSQSGTNDDPLSILKDVVHIQADSYDTRPMGKKIEEKSSQNKSILNTKTSNTELSTKPSISTSAKTQPQKEKVFKKASTTPATDATNKAPARMFLDSVDLTFYDDEPTSPPPVEKKGPSKPSQPSKSQSAVSKPQPAASKPQPSASKPQPTASKAQPAKTQSNTTKTPTILNRTLSKPAQLSSKVANTTIKSAPSSSRQPITSKTQPTTSKTQPTTSKTQPITITKTSSNTAVAKKRTAPVETAPPKKKKTDHLMTLKDFDIDDIDDIIELD